jgi:hypothetical protein
VHNTVISTSPPYSSIEWRFDRTTATVQNNLATHPTRERTSGIAVVGGNLDGADESWFTGAGDPHLVPGTPDVGADEG